MDPIATQTIIIIWIIGMIASFGMSFLWKHDFFDSSEAIRYIIKVFVISVVLSWVFFLMQMAIIIAIWHMYGDDDYI